MRKFITDEKFKQSLKSEESVEGVGLRKQFIAEVEEVGVEDKAEKEESRFLTFTISTATVDRAGDVVSIDGWDLENFLKNPVVLWAHSYSILPIARATKVWKHAGKLKATAEFQAFDMPVIGPLADAVYQSYKRGFMNAVSVGFLPKKWNWAEDENRKYGIDFDEQELLEFSAVPVPANPEALLGGKSLGVDVEPMKEWALSMLKALDEPTRKNSRVSVEEIDDLLKHAGRDPDGRFAANKFSPEVLKLRLRRLNLGA